jgi:hypothetical protein
LNAFAPLVAAEFYYLFNIFLPSFFATIQSIKTLLPWHSAAAASAALSQIGT